MAGYLVPTVRLASSLLEFLKEGPRTTDELCLHFGYSSSAIRYRLHSLEDARQIHHQKQYYTNGGGSYYVWHVGVRTSNAAAYPEPLACKPASLPVVIFRDPLVAALFGPAGITRSAPVCTACGVEQGAGHARDCIVSMVAA